MCCSGVCRIGVVVPTTDPDFPEFTVCPKKP